jgi:ferredoxin
MSTRAKLDTSLREHGLFVRGVTRLCPAEIETWDLDPDQADIALVGNIGSSYWPQFSRSAEFGDGAAHPLDRWSRRVATSVAQALSLRPLYPFEGPPYFPFQQWAKRAEAIEQSPIGVLMHPEFGLWHSYRFALLGSGLRRETSPAATESPCIACELKPCLHTCPVDAFDLTGYAVDACADYLRKTEHAECHRRGCLARHACPVAPEFRYADAQGSFHLRAFLRAD